MKHNFWPQNNEPFKALYQCWYHCKCCPCEEGEYPLAPGAGCPGKPWCRPTTDAEFFMAALLEIRVEWEETHLGRYQ